MYLLALMAPMAIKRRSIIYSAFGSLLGASLGPAAGIAGLGLGGCTFKPQEPVSYLSAARDKKGRYFGVFLGENLEIINKVLLPRRAHAAVYNKQNHEALFFSRRPGSEIFVLRRDSSRPEYTIQSKANRHFYGHGILSPEQKYLFTSENNIENSQGVIAIRDVRNNYQLIREMSSCGIGPHELSILSDAKTLVVANGGLRTHPDKKRIALNTHSMQPNMSFINWHTGERLAQYTPAHHQMSLRHMAVAEDDGVFVAVQYKGNVLDSVPLLVKVKMGEGIKSLASPANFSVEQKQYSASVCSVKGQTLMSCPKNNTLSLWQNNMLQDTCKIKDVAGVCVNRRATTSTASFIYSSGSGRIGRVESVGNRLVLSEEKTYTDLLWDNHLLAIV